MTKINGNKCSYPGCDMDTIHLSQYCAEHTGQQCLKEWQEIIKANKNYLSGADLRGAHFEKIDLRNANLRGADLTGAHLEEADLSGSNLEMATLSFAHLNETNLNGAYLRKVNFPGAFMDGVSLQGANLKQIDLRSVRLKRANFFVSCLYEVDFSSADLENATFFLSRFRNVKLSRANLKGAMFYESDLRLVELDGANLEKADFSKVNLKGANLTMANLEGASLYETNLESANLSYANLENANLSTACFKGANMKGVRIKGANIRSFAYDRKTCFVGIDTRDIDWSIRPLLRRDILDQQYIAAFKEKYPIIAFLWKLTSNYGRSLCLWALWSFGFILLFAFLYWCPFLFDGIKSFELRHGNGNFLDFVYFSVVTFTTLGFGDVVPKCLGAKIAVMFEVIIGYIMLGGLISIFATKLARRS